ncbi:1,6-anhydro-N-acetylmuramyl-L-alanine amidase AmpD [Rhodoferax saidenbachensis]|uniref:1,6-anhydro-N-acetylmuramyl-L-alanine amidase AmpD n=1 Tax=Rhodoferax saidenbachensis TaxID=1484693 RepID=A0ABU1ZKA5_9BURK|nr:1,6-anhydro-N-acetylmuramyl-L-alanine amidase AmpD [Rhodoferax saidenbachensis]MDR7305918.1 AmpD protein [Rhodoferax saidenbachensis]
MPDPHDALWQEGWYRFAHRLESPNFGPRPTATQVDLIVLHSISLPPGQYGTGQVQRLFTNTLDWNAHPYFKSIEGMQVSAHFFVQRNGDIWQFVSCDARAWHAGVSHYRGKGNCNDDSIGIELEGLEGHTFESAQYEALQALCPAIAQHYPIQYIAGHEHIAPGRKADPGPGFEWTRLHKSLGLPTSSFPADTNSLVTK